MPFSAPYWTPSQADAILFDWDGVLADTHLDFTAVREKYYGGNGKAMLLEDAHTLTPDRRSGLMSDLHDLEMHGAQDATPVRGAIGVLDWVRGHDMPWAVVSRNCRDSIFAAAEQCGIEPPNFVLSRDDGPYLKPDPRALYAACDTIGSDPKHTLFVGDYIYDMMGARRAGMRGVLVRKDVEPAWSPWLECTCRSMDGLLRALEEPSRIVAWEYQNTVLRLGREAFEANFAVTAELPMHATPDIAAWLCAAASLGIGAFSVDDRTFSASMWRDNPGLDPADMGKTVMEAVTNFMASRFPFVTLREPSDGDAHLPEDARDLIYSLGDAVSG